MSEPWEGREGRKCKEHRTVSWRAWCLDCRTWCYANRPCPGCRDAVTPESYEAGGTHLAEALRLLASVTDELDEMLDGKESDHIAAVVAVQFARSFLEKHEAGGTK